MMGLFTMRERYFDDGQVKREFIIDGHDTNTLVQKTEQDLEPIIDTVSQLRDLNRHIGHRKSRNMVHVAEIPMIEYERAVREGWAEDPKAWKRWLNDPANKPFRVTDGRA